MCAWSAIIRIMSSEKMDFRGTIQWYDQNAEQYTNAIKNLVSEKQISAFLSQLPSTAQILDAGCGGARDCMYFTEKGFSAIGLDISLNMLKAGKTITKHNELINSDYINSPFTDNQFDGIWAHASLHHLDTIETFDRAVGEFGRIIKPSGILHLATQARTINAQTSIMWDTLAGHERFYILLTLSELADILTKNQFAIQTITQHKETDDEINGGRVEVEWLVALAKRNIKAAPVPRV